MKRNVLLALIMFSLVTTGCDFLRKVTGRPTSADIEAKRLEILKMEDLKAKQAEAQSRLDSLRALEQAMADSLAIMDSLKEISSGTIFHPVDLGGLERPLLTARYYIVVGSFKHKANAEKVFDEVARYDYKPILMSFKNGFHAVGVCPSDKLSVLFEDLKLVRQEKFCPKDVWVLLNE